MTRTRLQIIHHVGIKYSIDDYSMQYWKQLLDVCYVYGYVRPLVIYYVFELILHKLLYPGFPSVIKKSLKIRKG